MRPRIAIAVLFGAFVAPPAPQAQQAAKSVRIGILSSGQTRSSPLYRAFEERLPELGYADGRNTAIEFRGAEGRPARIAELTKELVRLKADVLLTAGGEVAQ